MAEDNRISQIRDALSDFDKWEPDSARNILDRIQEIIDRAPLTPEPCKYVVSAWAGLPGSECIAFAEEGSDYCKPHGDALKALESKHKTEGGMCCNGKRGCGGPGSYCCSQTVYTHRHGDGSRGPIPALGLAQG